MKYWETNSLKLSWEVEKKLLIPLKPCSANISSWKSLSCQVPPPKSGFPFWTSLLSPFLILPSGISQTTRLNWFVMLRLDWCMVTSMMLSKIVFQSVRYFVEQTAVLFESGSGNKIDGYSSTLHWPWIFSCRRCSVFPTLWWRENQTLYQIAWARSSSKRWKPDCVVKAILLVSLNIGDKKN